MSNEKLKIFVTTKGSLDYVRLCGVIDEDNNLMSVLPRLTREVAVVGLREVTRINSLGVRDWVNWMNSLDGVGKRVVLHECSTAVVSQINLVANFSGKSHIESFLAPYFCSTCDAERLRLIQTRRLTGDPPRAPRALCDQCDSLMTLDEVEESYFSFIPRTRQAQVDTVVEKALAEVTPTIDAKLMLIDYTTGGPRRPSMAGEPTPDPKGGGKPVAGAAPSPQPSRPSSPAARPQPTAPPPSLHAAGGPTMAARGSVPAWFWPVVGLVVVASAGIAVLWRFVLN
jgi:hypothetical protein